MASDNGGAPGPVPAASAPLSAYQKAKRKMEMDPEYANRVRENNGTRLQEVPPKTAGDE